ncbi:hypothetical protein HRbin24_00476 [bacterium HR24]|nr:hypothetical protein HRbin24_00476 [bacterium HR24]
MQQVLDKVKPVSRAADSFRPTRNYDPDGDIKPFHEALVPEGVLRTSDFERSFSTALGTTFEEVAKLIARQHYAIAERAYKFDVVIPRVALDTIDGIISDISSDGMLGRYHDFVRSVCQAYRGDLVTRRPIVIDLYLKSFEGYELFFEMKSPKPNKDQAVGSVRKLLMVHGVRGAGPPHVCTYYAMAYNPYGDNRSIYSENVARKYLDYDNLVLIGKEFWDLIGGQGAYEEVLELYRQVGQEFKDHVWKTLAS